MCGKRIRRDGCMMRGEPQLRDDDRSMNGGLALGSSSQARVVEVVREHLESEPMLCFCRFECGSGRARIFEIPAPGSERTAEMLVHSEFSNRDFPMLAQFNLGALFSHFLSASDAIRCLEKRNVYLVAVRNQPIQKAVIKICNTTTPNDSSAQTRHFGVAAAQNVHSSQVCKTDGEAQRDFGRELVGRCRMMSLLTSKGCL